VTRRPQEERAKLPLGKPLKTASSKKQKRKRKIDVPRSPRQSKIPGLKRHQHAAALDAARSKFCASAEFD
jgi:hypothetical protein